MVTINNQTIFKTGFNLLNKGNQAAFIENLSFFGNYGMCDFAGIEAYIDRFDSSEKMQIEAEIVKQYREMDKFRAYIFCHAITNNGDQEFTQIKIAQVFNKSELFQNQLLEDLNWVEIPTIDPYSRRFAFYKLKEGIKQVPKMGGGFDYPKELKLLIFELELLCFGAKIWGNLKFPLISIEEYKPYKFEPERDQIFAWMQTELNVPIQILDMKEFYEAFIDCNDFSKMSWDVKSYRDPAMQLIESSFSIKLDYKEKVDLAKIYQSLNVHLNSEYQDHLEFLYRDYCKKNNTTPEQNTLVFLAAQPDLLNSELIFRGIQEKCEYLIGAIGLFQTFANNDRKEIVRYTIEKVKDETPGLLRTTREGDDYLRKIFPKIKKHFDPAATR